MQNLKVAVVQFNIEWENPVANRAILEEMIEPIEQVDLIVLPEMFNTGFSMNAKKIAESHNMDTHKWLKQMATRKNAVIMGSMAIFDAGFFYNRVLIVRPNGETITYNKHYLFTPASEHMAYTAGLQKTIFELNGWQIAPFICYDLRFGTWSNNVKYQYDLAIYMANWPTPRQRAWDTLLPARAVENQCYVLGCNRVGNDNNGLEYNGNSQIVDFLGEVLTSNLKDETILIKELNYQNLIEYRTKYPFIMDA